MDTAQDWLCALAPGVFATGATAANLDITIAEIRNDHGMIGNNPPMRLGPPHFDDATLSVPADGAAITIALAYP